LKVPVGYTVLSVKVPHLRENTYYQFRGEVQGDAVLLKVADFSPYGGALFSPFTKAMDHFTPTGVTFRTFKGITSATLYLLRRKGTGDAFVKNLTLYKLNIAIPPVDHTDAFSPLPAPLPENDGSYAVVDDADPALRWSDGWKGMTLPGDVFGQQPYYRNTVHMADKLGASMTDAFTGTGIGIYAMRQPAYGSMSVRIDDGQPETVALNTASDDQQLVYLKSGLAIGLHTLTVTHSDDKPINIDALRVLTK